MVLITQTILVRLCLILLSGNAIVCFWLAFRLDSLLYRFAADFDEVSYTVLYIRALILVGMFSGVFAFQLRRLLVSKD